MSPRPRIASRALGAAPLLVASLALAVAARTPVPSAAAVALIVVAALVGPVLALGRVTELIVTAIVLGAASFAGVQIALETTTQLAVPWVGGAVGALAVGALELVLAGERPRVGHATLAGLVAITLAGQTHLGLVYVGLVAGFLAVAAVALRSADVARGRLLSPPRRALVVGAVVAASTLVMAAGLVASLSPAARWTRDHVASAALSQSGFSDRLWLGSLDGMQQSDAIVMRVTGPRVDYLRGVVYDRYIAGRWSSTSPGFHRFAALVVEGASDPERDEVALISGGRDRLFLPLGAGAIDPGNDDFVVDRFGVLQRPGGGATRSSFHRGDDVAHVSAPTAADLALPPSQLAPVVAELAKAWTRGAATPAAKVAAIEKRLREGFTYSLRYERKRPDPMMDFLTGDRRGHCEYFASALALVARAAGVHARVVGGYRVSERSELGGYYIVRQRDAHAWVEAFVDGRWRTFDATPSGDGGDHALRATGVVSALVDRLAVAWPAVRAAFSQLGLVHVAGAAAVAALLLVLRRLLRRPAPPRSVLDVEPPSPAAARLLAALAARGVARRPSEPLERFADRVDAAGDARAADLVRRYAAQRYGGVGDAAILEAELTRQA